MDHLGACGVAVEHMLCAQLNEWRTNLVAGAGLQMTNLKLVERSKKIVMTATGVDYDTAAEVLDAADGHVKTALVMVLADVDAEAARARIEEADGFVRHAIAGTRPGAASG